MGEHDFIPAAGAPVGGPYTDGRIGANYPRNQWWVVANRGEITREPLQRCVLDLPVVLYRREDGSPVALDDRCPHRWAPLSKGWLEGDNLVCGYHGQRFAPEGQCVKGPTQPAIPAKACVHAYPLIERGPLVWIWTGDPARAAESSPPVVDWIEADNGWSVIGGYMAAECNYMLLKENVLDLTHFCYVHRKTFKILDWDRAPSVKVEDGQVEFRLEFPPTKLAPMFASITGFGDKPIARANWGRSVSQALHVAGQDFTDPDAAPAQRQTAAFRVLHATTPISPTRMHYFFMVAWNLPLTPAQRDTLLETTLAGFQEDKDMLEAIQSQMSKDPRGLRYPEVMLNSDQSAVQARRQLKRQIDTEIRK